MARRPSYEFPKPNKNGKLPFPYLPSLLLTATVLSYYDFKFEIMLLMNQLSKTTKQYINTTKLSAFIKDYTGFARHPSYKINFKLQNGR